MAVQFVGFCGIQKSDNKGERVAQSVDCEENGSYSESDSESASSSTVFEARFEFAVVCEAV